jgi:hypothetical protein
MVPQIGVVRLAERIKGAELHDIKGAAECTAFGIGVAESSTNLTHPFCKVVKDLTIVSNPPPGR